MDNAKNTPENPAGCISSSPDDDFNLPELNSNSKPPLGLKLERPVPLSAELEAKMTTLTESSSSRKRSREQYQSMSQKLKASNFPISSITVGTWKRVHTREGELTAKLYFAKRKLVWEFLDGQLKSKMEVAWSDIIAIRALMLPDQHGVLEIELSNPPLFFRELTPQPRKHTIWTQASDFTSGQAPLFRIHVATFPPGALDKHYEKLLQSDQNLLELSKRPFPSLTSPYFNTSTVLPFNIREEQTLVFHQQQPPLQFPIAPSLPSPLCPIPANPITTQELGFVNLSYMGGMASRNNQPTMQENRAIGLSNDARFVNDQVSANDPRFVEPSSDHDFYYEPPPLAEVNGCSVEFPPFYQDFSPFYQDFNPMIPSTSYNNPSDHEQVKMVQNNTTIDDHLHMFPPPLPLLPPPPPPLLPLPPSPPPHIQDNYDSDLGDEDLTQILHSFLRVQKSPSYDVQRNHKDP